MKLLGLKTKFCLSNLTIRKTLKISFNQHQKYNLGEIINLGTVDSNKFSSITDYLLYILSMPITLIIGLFYMYYLVGVSLFIGLFAMAVLMFINIYVVKKGIKF